MLNWIAVLIMNFYFATELILTKNKVLTKISDTAKSNYNTAFLNSIIFILLTQHFRPINKAVNIQCQKRCKTHYHRQISNVGKGLQYPHNYKHYVVCSIPYCIKSASSGSKIRCGK